MKINAIKKVTLTLLLASMSFGAYQAKTLDWFTTSYTGVVSGGMTGGTLAITRSTFRQCQDAVAAHLEAVSESFLISPCSGD